MRPRPLVWVLLGEKKGDNAQAIAAAEVLAIPFDKKKLVVSERFRFRTPRVRPSMHHIDLTQSDTLAEPWPDMIIVAGRRLSMVALWVKQQSVGRSKIVLLGAPKGNARSFDLAIVPTFYRPTKALLELRVKLPLIGLNPQLLSNAERCYKDSIGQFPKPLTVVLFGGPVGNMVLNASTALQIIAKIESIYSSDGSLAICASRRTPQDVLTSIEKALPSGAKLYLPSAPDNPYLGLVAHGDRFVVTGDSVSMLVEIARLGKPLAIAELASRWPRYLEHFRRRFLPPARELELLHNQLYQEGLAVRFTEPFRHHAFQAEQETAIVRSALLELIKFIG